MPPTPNRMPPPQPCKPSFCCSNSPIATFSLPIQLLCNKVIWTKLIIDYRERDPNLGALSDALPSRREILGIFPYFPSKPSPSTIAGGASSASQLWHFWWWRTKGGTPDFTSLPCQKLWFYVTRQNLWYCMSCQSGPYTHPVKWPLLPLMILILKFRHPTFP